MIRALIIATTALTITGSGAFAQGSAEAGADVFRKCASCHKVGPNARNAVGPVLNGVIGRQAGTAPDYNYSELNKAAGTNGLVWTEENIFTYLADPSPFLKKFLTDKGKADLASGATKMVFKLPDETDRRDVIAYLRTFAPEKKATEEKKN
ncbi:MAG TPA: cytochrome c family protein [Hyphomicrobiaceae bacterium]|nr:cytochrome c family protein [Hyphomicrobiaceae bacterium]